MENISTTICFLTEKDLEESHFLHLRKNFLTRFPDGRTLFLCPAISTCMFQYMHNLDSLDFKSKKV